MHYHGKKSLVIINMFILLMFLELGISLSASGNTGRDIKGAGVLELGALAPLVLFNNSFLYFDFFFSL